MDSASKKIIIYGAGDYGKRILDYIPTEDILFYIDQDKNKQEEGYWGFKVLSVKEALPYTADCKVILALSSEKKEVVRQNLLEQGIEIYKTYFDIQKEDILKRLAKRANYIDIYNKAINWINNNTVENAGIITTSIVRKPYPEVSGYYIPTLIKWGYKEKAIQYAEWLISVQKEDGSWYDSNNEAPYIFDSGQILKGLLAVRDIFPNKSDLDYHIKKGCDWIVSRIDNNGRLSAPNEKIWGDGRTMNELIHLYCLSPLMVAARIYNNMDYEAEAKKCLCFYIKNYRKQITDFHLLSHFYAYIMEALVDMGEISLAKEAMDNIKRFQHENGAVAAYKNADWVCSTGLFQLALVWIRLGDIEAGKKAFDFACRLQNKTGGWYGSYRIDEKDKSIPDYFPGEEISWANKYFLDALYYKNKAEFEKIAPIFKNTLSENDGRYKCIENIIKGSFDNKKKRANKVLDVGCGKGAYLKNLRKVMPDCYYCAVDISESVMSYINDEAVEKKCGSLTDIPYSDETFDVVYTCEALEHAIDIESAIREMSRVTRKEGYIVVIDKNKDRLGEMEIGEWEQWFDENELKTIMDRYCSSVEVKKRITYEKDDYGLFYAWVGKVK